MKEFHVEGLGHVQIATQDGERSKPFASVQYNSRLRNRELNFGDVAKNFITVPDLRKRVSITAEGTGATVGVQELSREEKKLLETALIDEARKEIAADFTFH